MVGKTLKTAEAVTSNNGGPCKAVKAAGTETDLKWERNVS